MTTKTKSRKTLGNSETEQNTGTELDTESTVGGWTLLDAIGGGRMSRVYRARPAEANADAPAAYAVKMLRPDWQDRSEAIVIIRREAVLGNRLRNAHLVPVLTAHVLQRPYFLVMPHLCGATLAEIIARESQLSICFSLWIARQIAEALDTLHQAGWMHCDVKPGNIFVSPEGHATLLDLGFASQPSQACSPWDRPLLGTFHYIAPEMIRSRLAVDRCCDIYSLGATLYQMLSGRLPHEGSSPAELAASHLRQNPTPLESLVPEVPRAVSRLVSEMLSKQPLRRPNNAAELAQEISMHEINALGRQIPKAV